MLDITINTEFLKSTLGKIQGITGRKTALSVTECVKIEASGRINQIAISATDPETFSIETDGSAFVAVVMPMAL